MICNFIDNKYEKCNYCDFKDNMCVFFRNNEKIAHIDGCCYSDKRGGACKYLKNHRCTIKAISCKLYSCEYLRKRKVNFKMKDIPLIKYFFNLRQKYFIKYSFFKPKEYVMDKLSSSRSFESLKLRKHIKNEKLVFDLTNYDLKRIIKKTKKFIKICDRKKLVLEFKYNDKLLDEKMLNEKISDELRDIITIMHAINIKDKYNRYDYIYDTVCYYLDERRKSNYCQFKDDVCLESREKNRIGHKNGCCEWKGRGKCKYLIDSVCTLDNCMACKLFTCKSLKKIGISQHINDYVLTKYFLTSKEKDVLQFSYWTPKEEVMEKLLKCRK